MQYSEASYYGKRDFLLETPYLLAKGRQTPDGTDYDCKLELHSLSSEYSKLRRILRNHLCQREGALWVRADSLLVCCVIPRSGFDLRAIHAPENPGG
jgi:hypothetical protein